MTTIPIDVLDGVEILKHPSEIENHNTIGMCCEKECANSETNYMIIKLYGMELHIVLCDIHAEMIYNAISRRRYGEVGPKPKTEIVEGGKCYHCGRRHEPFQMRTIILGYHEGIPIIKAYAEQGTGFLTFWCDYCNKEHLHGRGEGHRIAHCHGGKSAFEKKGYYLNKAGGVSKR
jgi:hypothetical protein